MLHCLTNKPVPSPHGPAFADSFECLHCGYQSHMLDDFGLVACCARDHDEPPPKKEPIGFVVDSTKQMV